MSHKSDNCPQWLVCLQEMTSIDNVMKTKLTNYNLAKGSLVQMQRKKTYVCSFGVLAIPQVTRFTAQRKPFRPVTH